MRRRAFFAAAGALALPLGARAQAAAARIGMLDPSPSRLAEGRNRELRAGMKALGYEEGRHYALEYRSAEGRFERLPALAAELVRLPVRVLIARNSPGMQAARAATRTIPILMADVGDPLGLGFVKSLGRPEGNVTGLSNATVELIRKRIDILRELVPGLARLAVLGNADDPNTPLQVAEVGAAAKALALTTRVFDARDDAGLGRALADIEAWKPQALLPLVHPLRAAMSPKVMRWGLERRLPVMPAFPDEVRGGGLLCFAADLSDQYRRLAIYVDRLLRGATPAELPVERPNRYTLSINLRTAQAIGIAIPNALLVRADEIVQ